MTKPGFAKQVAYEEARAAFARTRREGRGIGPSVHAAVDAAAPHIVTYEMDEALDEAYRQGLRAALEMARKARADSFEEQRAGLDPKAWETADWLCNRLTDMEREGRPL